MAIGTFWVGIIKAPVFAFIIAMVGCYEGLKVSRSAEVRLLRASVVIYTGKVGSLRRFKEDVQICVFALGAMNIEPAAKPALKSDGPLPKRAFAMTGPIDIDVPIRSFSGMVTGWVNDLLRIGSFGPAGYFLVACTGRTSSQ